MLVLSRKHLESVVVGKADGFDRLLKVTVLGIHGTKVKLGFEVDPEVLVHRSEVWERLQDGGQRKRPQSSPPAMNQELGRWEDDGGGPTAATTSEGSSEPASDRESIPVTRSNT